MAGKIDRAALAQHWVHAHEEDSDSEMVFRPASYKFGPSRGRSSFDLKPDGSLIEGGIGPTDRREESRGTWKLNNAGNLELSSGAGNQPANVMKLASLDANRLVVKK
jgi:hypothetical protein